MTHTLAKSVYTLRRRREDYGLVASLQGQRIRIEAVSGSKQGVLVSDFSCGGIWRALIDEAD
jgi:hypothetical protein